MNTNKDILLISLFEQERWQSAIGKGFDKDIRKDQLLKLTRPSVRAALYKGIRDGSFTIAPPHTALIPKDNPGEFRTVYVNEPIDRIVLSIVNDLLFEKFPEMIHPSCKSYLKGTGCGNVVRKVTQVMMDQEGNITGWKADLSKYFDSVPLRYIDGVFDYIEGQTGKSTVIDLVRKYYHTDYYFDTDGNLQKQFQSLKQGCAVAAFLADVILYHIDKRLSQLDGYYVRYSDDMLFIGPDHEKAMTILTEELAKMDMKLNPAKVEPVCKDKWFKFLGFSIKGESISLSRKRIKDFEKEIRSRTIKNGKPLKPITALKQVNKYLYKGDGQHSWASQVLSVCNVKKDIDTLNAFVIDALRATVTGKTKLGGLGYNTTLKEGCIHRGTGANVSSNRKKEDSILNDYKSLGCMRKALLTSKALYDTLILGMN